MEPLSIALAVVLAVAAAMAGFVVGRRSPGGRSRPAVMLRRLEEYDFYPFTVNEDGLVEFASDAFDLAVQHFLAERNPLAARELIVIGEQNLVRDTFPSDRLGRYRALYAAYDGDQVVSDNDAFLENYRRIVNQLGRSFPGTGVEILLHNLVNPSHSLVAIENAIVTGRSVGSGATNLVLDLKTRRQRGEDKVNYELTIGSRRFKCTTIPIFRPDYGLVGAICINIDARFMREYVMETRERLAAFFDNFLRTDFQLDENILSSDEYANALNGKRHFLDEAIRASAPAGSAPGQRRLAAIFFSDIVGYSALMGSDEKATLAIVEANEQIHRAAFASHAGRLIKRLGDGMLASFDSVSNAVAAAKQVRTAVRADGRFGVRIGIHMGEVVQKGSDVFGDGMNIAARIQAEVSEGEIGISEVVYNNVKNKEGVAATRIGERSLKNIAEPIVLYTVEG